MGFGRGAEPQGFHGRDCWTRNPLRDMKTSTLTIRLDKDLDDLLTRASRQSGKNRSEVAHEALRLQLRISQFEALRRRPRDRGNVATLEL